MGIELEAVISPAVSSSTKDYVPVIKNLAIGNDSDAAVTDLKVHIRSEPHFSVPKTINVKRIGPNERIKIKNADVHLADEFLDSVSERTEGKLMISVEMNGKTVADTERGITVLPKDEWFGIGLPELTGAFITPNDPGVLRIAANAAKLLETWTGNATPDRYVSGDRNNVRRDASAIYAALQSFNIRSTPSKDIAKDGCRVTSAKDIIDGSSGSSFDLVLLFASCAMSVGLNTAIIFTKRRAIAGVWTDKTVAHDKTETNASDVMNTVRIGALMLLDCDGITTNKRTDIETSEAHAKKILLNDGDFLLAMDSALIRGADPSSVFDKKQTFGAEDIEALNIKGNELTKMESWERRLLDLTPENELIKLRMNDTLLPIMTSNLNVLKDALGTGGVFTMLGKPPEWDAQKMNEQPFELSRHVGRHEVLIEQELKYGQLRAPYSEREVRKRLGDIHRTARAEEGNCKCVLFVVMGLLKWFDSDGEPVYSPLVLMPAETNRRYIDDTIEIRAKDDESLINKTLLEKLRHEHDIILSLDPLPTDRTGIDLDRIFESVSDAVRSKDGWDVIEGAFMGIFRPGRYEMWKYIRNRSDKLFSNKLTKSIIEGKLAWEPQSIDDIELYKRPIFAFNSNNVQLTGVKAAADGRTFVVQSSPSTGRTQMIANMIANCIYRNKTVLLVSERDASLRGIKKRLDDINIGLFCLYLTTANADKKRVLDNFRAVLDSAAVRQEANYRSAAENMERMISELNEPLRAMKRVRNCGLNIYEIVVRYNELDRTGARDIEIPSDVIRAASHDSIGKWDDMVKRLIAAAESLGHPKGHPLNGVGITSFGPSTEMDVKETLDRWIGSAEEADRVAKVMTEVTGAAKGCDPNALAKLLVSLNELPADVLRSESITATGKKVRETVKTMRQSFEIVNNLRRTFVYDAMVGDVSSLEKNHDRMHSALDSLSGIRLDGIDLDLVERYVEDIHSAKDVMIASLNLSKEVRKEWNDSIMNMDVNEILTKYRAVGEKKIFAGGAKKAFMRDISEHLKNKDETFERVTVLIRSVEDYTASMNGARVSLENVDALEGGKYADLIENCRRLERLADLVDEKTASLSAYGDPDRLCRMFVTDAKVKNSASELVSLTDQLKERRSAVETLLVTDIGVNGNDDIEDWRGLYKKWTDNIGELEKASVWNACCKSLIEEGLGCVPDAYMDGMEHDKALISFRSSVYSSLMDAYIRSEPSFAMLDAAAYEEKAQKFRESMRRFIPLCRREIGAALTSKVPDITATSSDPIMRAVQNAIVTWGRRVTLRTLLNEVKDAMPRIFPCMMMSPSSVPHYLGDDVTFDVVILDDASMMPTDKAISIITRGTDAVVIGDPQYIPPVVRTRDGMAEVSSILSECVSLGLPVCDLKWLYGDESLVEFCNEMFSGGTLNTFPPANKDRRRGLKGVFVSTHAEDPNAEETKMIVKKVMMELRGREDKKKSIGVVAFNEAQRQSIEDALRKELSRYPALSLTMQADANPLFVRLADNLQNRERDVILISVGIWKDKNGALSDMSMLEGRYGDRILNGALSCARKEISVFTTLRPDDIPNSSSKGVTALKALLEYTEKGSKRPEAPADSICSAVAKELTDRGYTVRKNIGSSNAKIDIGIVDPKNPDKYILGILLDGGDFISMSAVDTNFTHPMMLTELGWNIYHLWTIYWMEDPAKEMDIICKRIEKILKETAEEHSAGSILDVMMISELPKKTASVRVDIGRRVRQLYTKATIMEKTVSLEALFSTSSRNMVERDIIKIVDTESPISAVIVAKRLCDAYGIKDPSEKLIDHLIGLMDSMDVTVAVSPWGTKILWRYLRSMSMYDTYRVPPRGEKRDLRDVADKEQANAILESVLEHSEISSDELIARVGEIFGNEEMTEEDKKVVMMCIDGVIKEGLLKKSADGKITLDQ